MSRLKKTVLAPLILCGVIVAIFVIDVVLPLDLIETGIRPRRFAGLYGILTSPLLHSGWLHLTSNIPPLFVMGCMVSALDPNQFAIRTIVLIGLSGGLTWLISSAGIVVGASGLVFAYWSFLIVYGLRARTLRSTFFALVTGVVYGALVFALFQYVPGVSFAAHVSGVIAGVVLAIVSTRAVNSANV